MKDETLKNNKEDFADVPVNYALVVKGDVLEIKQLKKEFEKCMDALNIKVIFQTQSVDKLWIKRESTND